MKGKLYRSRTDSVLGGVCGGLGQYLGIDPTLVRLIAILLGFITYGSFVVVYILFWVIIPKEGLGEIGSPETVRMGADEIAEKARSFSNEMRSNRNTNNTQTTMLIGLSLILLGALFLLQNMNFVFLRWLNWGMIWPVFLIIGGGWLVWDRVAKGE